MRFEWLHQTGARKVIVIFGGWGFGPAAFAHLEGGQDVLFVSDYRDLDALLPDLSAYETRSLVAWSFGVAAFAHWQADQDDAGVDFTRRIAIAGSHAPVDARRGIPPRLFHHTLDTLSAVGLRAFREHACDGPPPEEEADLAALRAELKAVAARGEAPEIAWDRIWLPTRDRIFPPANLVSAFAGQADAIRVIEAPHAPFACWHDWAEVLA